MQDHALALGRDEKANRLDVGQRDFVEIQDRWSTTRGNLRAHMNEVFRLHVTDQTNRCSRVADLGDDPQCHVRGRANVRRACNGQTRCRSIEVNVLRGSGVLSVQNLLIGRHSRRTAAGGERQRLLYRCLSIPNAVIFESSV